MEERSSVTDRPNASTDSDHRGPPALATRRRPADETGPAGRERRDYPHTDGRIVATIPRVARRSFPDLSPWGSPALQPGLSDDCAPSCSTRPTAITRFDRPLRPLGPGLPITERSLPCATAAGDHSRPMLAFRERCAEQFLTNFKRFRRRRGMPCATAAGSQHQARNSRRRGC